MVKSQKQILSKETQKILKKKKIKGNKKKWNSHTDGILKYVKCQWGKIIHIKITGKYIES